LERITSYQFTELIESGFALIPEEISKRLKHVHFFTGTDPVYAGLFDDKSTKDGRSYRDTWCCSYPWNQTVEDKRTTIVMTDLLLDYPKALRPAIVVHELAHCLHEVLDFEPLAKPVTKYAQTDEFEAFADAFTLWVFPEYDRFYELINKVDDEMIALFSQLKMIGG